MSKIKKIWGELDNIFYNDKVKIDVLYLQAETACSIHFHRVKCNIFYLIRGSVKIKTDLGDKKLKIGEKFTVTPNITHQFIALKDSTLIEIAFVDEGQLKEQDIVRKFQGGKFIKGKFYTLEQLKEENWKEYKSYE